MVLDDELLVIWRRVVAYKRKEKIKKIYGDNKLYGVWSGVPTNKKG
jgi:hypothetical protein